MENVIRRCGRFTLVRTEEGFFWSLTSRGGQQWFWHPGTRQWTERCECSRTERAATAGLDPSALPGTSGPDEQG
jgi:hypothetical protein